MMDEPGKSRINWRVVYGAVLAWLVLMIVLMRLFPKVF
jgi:hypothetical protein